MIESSGVKRRSSKTSIRRRAYTYLRFSAPEQASGDSERRQLTLATDYANRHDLHLDETLTFRDLGISAYRGLNAETGQLATLLEAVRTGLIPPKSVILVENLDRLSRQTARRALRVIEDIVEMGVSIVTLIDEREYTAESLDEDPLNLLIALLSLIRANEESVVKSRRIAASWANRRAQAADRPLTAICPGWMRLARDGKSFKLIPQRAAVVRRIFNDAKNGFGSLTISRCLNIERVPLFSSFGRIGQMWTYGNISQLLKNPSVTGTLIPHKIEHFGGKKLRVPMSPVERYYPAVVSTAMFEAVQEIRRSAVSNQRRMTALPAYNIIGRLGACSSCGSATSLVSRSSHGSYLVCSRAYMKAGCKYDAVRYAEVETSIVGHLKELALTKRFRSTPIAANFGLFTDAPNLDRPKLNALLRSVLSSVIIFPGLGALRLNWKQGRESMICEAFTTLKRPNSKSQ